MKPLLISVFRYWRTGLAIFVLVFTGVSLYLIGRPAAYEVRMSYLVKNDRSDPVVTPGSSGAAVRTEVSEADVNTEMQLMTNPDLLRRAVRKAGLSGPQPVEVERAAAALSKRLKVTPIHKTSIIEVSYTSSDPESGLKILQTLSELYLQDHFQLHRKAGAEEVFGAQTEQAKQNMQAASAQLIDLRTRNAVADLPAEKTLAAQRVADTEQALAETRGAKSEAEAHISIIRRQIASLQARIITQKKVIPNQYSVERLHTLLAELQNRRTELASKFRPEDRVVADIDAEIRDTTEALSRAGQMSGVEETTDVNPVRASLEAELAHSESSLAGVQAKLAVQTDELGRRQARMRQLNSITAQDEELAREAKQGEQDLALYSQKQEEARVADLLDQKKIANVSLAQRPTKPVLPQDRKILISLAAALLAGLVASLAVTLIRDNWRETYECEADLLRETELPVLASVPMIEA